MDFLVGFILGIVFMLWVFSEFTKDRVSKKRMFFIDNKGKWVPKDPRI